MRVPPTRRALLSAAPAVAALAATSPVPAATAASNPDAELLELGRQHEICNAQSLALSDEAAALHEVVIATYPPRPEVLRIRLSDHPICNVDLGARRVGEFMTYKDIERWRINSEMAWMLTLRRREEMLLRRAEVLDAHDRWLAERGRMYTASGLGEMDARIDELGEIQTNLEHRIFAMRAHTPAGWRLKARIARQVLGDEPDGTYEDHVARSLLADLTADEQAA